MNLRDSGKNDLTSFREVEGIELIVEFLARFEGVLVVHENVL